MRRAHAALSSRTRARACARHTQPTGRPVAPFCLPSRNIHPCCRAHSPILVRIETKAGHGAGTATSKRLAATADLYTFVLKSLGVQLDER